VTELEHALLALGREVDVPTTPDLVPSVMRQVVPRRRHWRRRPLALAVAFALLAVLAATLAIPDARSALLRVLHIGGEEIRFVDDLPEVPSDSGLPYRLGFEVSLAQAERRAGFRLRELDEKPDHVYLGEYGTVWFLYGSPEHVRLLVAQTAKLGVQGRFFFKLVSSETQVTAVTVGGAKGYFLSGAPHVVLLVDKNGYVVDDSARLARDVLIWARDGVTYRLEGEFGKTDGVRLAGSLR
jgi:hypothetical protein